MLEAFTCDRRVSQRELSRHRCAHIAGRHGSQDHLPISYRLGQSAARLLPSVGQRRLVQRLSDKPCHISSRFLGCRALHGTVPKTTGQPANGSFHYHSHANEMIHLPVGQLSSVLCHAKRGSPEVVMQCGKVYLIGAGPGDADLLTIKAARLIGQVDTILVDELVKRDVLPYALTDAEIIHVGNRGGRMSTPQEYINQLCLEHVEAGKDVARLKGGDPFIFGRGGEELFTLRRAGVVVEVISGLTSGIAVPAAFDIPLTYRHIAQTATFVTGTTSGNDEVC